MENNNKNNKKQVDYKNNEKASNNVINVIGCE